MLVGDGEHRSRIETRDAADLQALDAALAAPAARAPARASSIAVQADKRATLDLGLDHLLSQAPARPAPAAVPLPAAGSPFGSLVVNADKCTMCLSCVGACPEAALADNPNELPNTPVWVDEMGPEVYRG